MDVIWQIYAEYHADYGNTVEIETGSRIPIWRAFVFPIEVIKNPNETNYSVSKKTAKINMTQLHQFTTLTNYFW